MIDFVFKPGERHERVTTRAGYDRWSEIYDGEDNPLAALDEAHLPAVLGDVNGLDVLDLGCGTGRWSVRLAAAGGRVTAMDFSAGMLEQARAKAGWERVRFVPHDLTQPLPLSAASFDRVLAALVVDHIADLPAFFRECGRVCKPSGAVVISTVHPAMMLRGIQAHFRDPRSGLDVLPAAYPHQISDYVMGAVLAGLRIEHISEYAVDQAMAERSQRAAKYRGWPMLLLMRLRSLS